MCAVSAGLLRAALELQGTPLLILNNATVTAATSQALAVLREVFPRWTEDELAPPEQVLRFAAEVAGAGARTVEVTESDKVMKMSGTRFEDATGGTFAILTLERVLRPWDMVVDEKKWRSLLMNAWPYALYAGERREGEGDTVFHAANDVGARLLGLGGAYEVKATSAASLGWSAHELAAWADDVRRAAAGDGIFAVERARDEAAGGHAVMRSSGVVFFDPKGGRDFRFISTAADVTEARDSARQLSNWKLLFERAPLGMGIARIIDNDTDVLYETVNPLIASMLETLGGPRPPGGYRGSQLRNDAEGSRFLAQAIQCRDLGHPIDLEYTSTTPHVKHWKVHYVPLGDNRFGWIAQDITVQKELELVLRKNGEQLERAVAERTHDLEAALQVKSRFLAVVSHELRTPIAGVLGSMDLLSETVQLDEEQATLLRIARTCGEQLSMLIADILDFTKLQEKRVALQEAEFSLWAMLENVVDIASLAAQDKTIEIMLEPPERELPDIVYADASRLRQILLNLVNNSIKFTADGEVSLAVSHAVDTAGRSMLSISVRDTGIGIPEHVRDKIFQPFSQADTSVSRRFGGSGLGLSISKHLAQLMGGDLTFESAGLPGAGSAFTLCVPVLVVRRFEPPPPAEPPGGARLRLVVIERHAALRRAAEAAEATGHTGAKRARDGDEERQPAAVVIVDQRLAREARAALSRRAAAWVAYGYARYEGALQGEPPCAFVKKPVHAAALRAALLDAARAVAHLSAPATAVGSAPPGAKRPLRRSSERVQGGAALRILVAEDNASNQLILRRYLELLGCNNFKVVENGVEAVREATKADYDVILMDVMMPVMSGLEASERILGSVPAERRPYIVAVTASAFEEDQQRCLAAGMQAVLTKPVDRAKLEQLLSARTRAAAV